MLAALQATRVGAPTKITVLPWGDVWVRPTTVDDVEAQTDQGDANQPMTKGRMARAAARVITDEHGTRLFDPNNAEHIALLGQQPWSLLRKVLEASDVTPGNSPSAASSSTTSP